MVAKGGARLLDPEAERAYAERLFPLADVLTPNLPEAEALLGRPVRTREAMREAARDLRAPGPARRWWSRAATSKATRRWTSSSTAERLEELPAPRIATRNTHGTGCTYSAAIAARLALGAAPLEAVRGAKEYLTEAIRALVRGGPRPRARGPPAPACTTSLIPAGGWTVVERLHRLVEPEPVAVGVVHAEVPVAPPLRRAAAR